MKLELKDIRKSFGEKEILTTKPSGTGLGLKSVAAIVKNNSGFLEIDDRNGVFAVFATLKN